jgi:peptidoglycan/xylan/chitin deacetylase (PgdA/CDA1 family)
VDPYQPLTVTDLATLITAFQSAKYKFISPADLEKPLQATDKRVLLTFDDGYANNLRALPVMRQFNVPATFFVTSGNIASGEPFWWDVLYRERLARGTAKSQIVTERQRFKGLNNQEIKANLRSLFGDDVFTARSNADRPMSVAELKQLASDPLVSIGNHTVDHELLTKIPLPDARRQIEQCQEMLLDWTGKTPSIIAYPNGIHNAQVVAEAEAAGLSIAVASLPGKVGLPLSPNHRMRLPRYAMIGGPSLQRQCQVVMAPFSTSGIKNAILSRRQQAALP